MKPKICPFWNAKCGETTPEGIDCEKNYLECPRYAWLIYQNTIALPLICPHFFSCKHQKEGKSCCLEEEAEFDYRDCEHFSRWFWELKAKR